MQPNPVETSDQVLRFLTRWKNRKL